MLCSLCINRSSNSTEDSKYQVDNTVLNYMTDLENGHFQRSWYWHMTRTNITAERCRFTVTSDIEWYPKQITWASNFSSLGFFNFIYTTLTKKYMRISALKLRSSCRWSSLRVFSLSFKHPPMRELRTGSYRFLLYYLKFSFE